MKKLKVENLSVKFDDKYIVKDINIYVNEGELVSIIGISGSGKTTIFNAITSIINIETGTILLNGENIVNKPGKVSYMLQKDLLLPFKTILDNIALPLIIRGIPKKKAYEKVNDTVDIFGLRDFLKKYPRELSGGQRQRVALLRTYLFSNDMSLLDEPFSALDYITKKNIHKWYQEVRKSLNLSTLLITHDIEEAINLSDRIYILKNGIIYKEYILKNVNNAIKTLELKEKILNDLK